MLLIVMAVTCWTLRVSIYICMFRCAFEICNFYPLTAATIKAGLNKFLNDYVVNVTRRKRILSDSGTQFASMNWKNELADIKTDLEIW